MAKEIRALFENKNYEIGNLIGEGSYGDVFLAFNKSLHQKVAVKRIPSVVEELRGTKKAIRELQVLHSLRHSNILSLVDVELHGKSLFLITEFCEYDLAKLISSDEIRTSLLREPQHYLSILCQLLQATRYMHAAGVLHRDIKPPNVLITSNCTVKLCDFGLSRVIDSDESGMLAEKCEPLTEYMVTRWYRAPEIVLNPGRYGKAQDVWAVACTFAELIRLSPLFPGHTVVHQLQVIVDVLGRPTKKDLDFSMNERSKRYIQSLSSEEKGLLRKLIVCFDVHSDLFECMCEMLVFNPNHRITSEEALDLPLFRSVLPAHDISYLNPPSVRNTISSVTWSNETEELLDIVKSEVTFIKSEKCTKQKTEEHVISSSNKEITDNAEGVHHDETLSNHSSEQIFHQTSRRSYDGEEDELVDVPVKSPLDEDDSSSTHSTSDDEDDINGDSFSSPRRSSLDSKLTSSCMRIKNGHPDTSNIGMSGATSKYNQRQQRVAVLMEEQHGAKDSESESSRVISSKLGEKPQKVTQQHPQFIRPILSALKAAFGRKILSRSNAESEGGTDDIYELHNASDTMACTARTETAPLSARTNVYSTTRASVSTARAGFITSSRVLVQTGRHSIHFASNKKDSDASHHHKPGKYIHNDAPHKEDCSSPSIPTDREEASGGENAPVPPSSPLQAADISNDGLNPQVKPASAQNSLRHSGMSVRHWFGQSSSIKAQNELSSSRITSTPHPVPHDESIDERKETNTATTLLPSEIDMNKPTSVLSPIVKNINSVRQK